MIRKNRSLSARDIQRIQSPLKTIFYLGLTITVLVSLAGSFTVLSYFLLRSLAEDPVALVVGLALMILGVVVLAVVVRGRRKKGGRYL